MPSTIVKLGSSDARGWAHNQPVWINENGEVARPVTRPEQFAISRALERTRNVAQSFRLTLPLHEVVQTRNGIHARSRPQAVGRNQPAPAPVEMMECAFEVVQVGRKRVCTIWSGDLRYATGREVLAARLLADHGECVLHGRNGKCIGVLRDPLVSTRPVNYGRRVQFSRDPQEAERTEAALDRVGVTPVQRQQIKRARFAGSVKPTYSPEQCPNDCRGRRGGGEWALAKGARPPTEREHHPICKFAPAWAETLQDVSTNVVLYDLELSTIARSALPDEVLEADEAEARTGMRQITVSGRLFAVLPIDQAESAALEARGLAPRGGVTAASDLTVRSALRSDSSADSSASSDPNLSEEPQSEDLGDSADASEFPLAPPAGASFSERTDWPTLDELQPAAGTRPQGAVTASTYLRRGVTQAGAST